MEQIVAVILRSAFKNGKQPCGKQLVFGMRAKKARI